MTLAPFASRYAWTENRPIAGRPKSGSRQSWFGTSSMERPSLTAAPRAVGWTADSADDILRLDPRIWSSQPISHQKPRVLKSCITSWGVLKT